jgi:thymidylate synthase (FAD)
MTAVLKWITPDAENIIVNIARVSNPANRDNTETATRLIAYLIKNAHWSPFEMANVCIEVNTSRAISAQILRHRSFTFQEYSQRYAVVATPKVPPQRMQDAKNRQSSHDTLDADSKAKYEAKIQLLFNQIDELYNGMLADGIAKETARMIMPMCSDTTLIINGTIRSWLFYILLRMKEGTQAEHRDITLQCLAILREQIPNVCQAFFPE